MKNKIRNVGYDLTITNSWCHLCGQQTKPLISFYVPMFVEHNIEHPTAYVRLCLECVNDMKSILLTWNLE